MTTKQESKCIYFQGISKQAAQKRCGVSSGDTEKPPGQYPVQPVLGEPALAQGLDR